MGTVATIDFLYHQELLASFPLLTISNLLPRLNICLQKRLLNKLIDYLRLFAIRAINILHRHSLGAYHSHNLLLYSCRLVRTHKGGIVCVGMKCGTNNILPFRVLVDCVRLSCAWSTVEDLLERGRSSFF